MDDFEAKKEDDFEKKNTKNVKKYKNQYILVTLCAARGDDDDDGSPRYDESRQKKSSTKVDGSKARVVVSVPRDEGVRHSFSL